MSTATPLDALSKLSSYRARREKFFPSDSSLQWYMRQHRMDLIACGAIVRQRGQWYVHEQRFDEYVLIAAMEDAKRFAARQAAASTTAHGVDAPGDAQRAH